MQVAFFPQPINVDESVISAQFVEVPGISHEAESKLWATYVSKVHEFGKEKLHRFKEMELEVLEVWRGVRAESDKSSDLFTMNVMLQRMQCREPGLSDDQLYRKYLEMKLEHFIKQIELHEACFTAYFKLERKKYNYALKIRGMDRTDIPYTSRYSIENVREFIKELEESTHVYDKNVHRMRINLKSMVSHPIIAQLQDLFVETFKKQKALHLKEIKYYQGLVEQAREATC